MGDSNPLWQDIIEFSRNKTKLAISFIVLGILGLVLPVIPGILLLGLGVFLIKPDWYSPFREWFEK